MSPNWRSVDVALHARALALLCPTGWEVSVADQQNLLLGATAVSESLWQALTSTATLDETPQIQTHPMDGETIRYLTLPLIVQSIQVGQVLVYSGDDAAPLPNISQLRLCADMLAREIGLSEELDTLAEELIERYEELNLVYSSGDDFDQEMNDEQQLQQAVENVVQYLDAEIALIAIPSRGLWLLESATPGNNAEITDTVSVIGPPILQWLQDNDQPLVINESKERMVLGVDHPPDYRILATPIRDHDGDVIGAFAMARPHGGEKISNGEKNLLSAMASKVGRAVQQYYDPVTGLARQNKFCHRLHQELERQRPDQTHTLVHLSIPEITDVSSNHGVQIADRIVADVAERAGAFCRETDLLARLDDGDMVMLMHGCPATIAAAKFALFSRLVAHEPFVFGTQQVDTSLRVGVAELLPADRLSVDDALARAQIANRIARENTDGSVSVFDQDDQLVIQQQSASRIVATVRRALTDDTFALFAQDIAPLNSSDQNPHFEILLRLFDSDGDMVSPAEFIPLAERHNLMAHVDLWVVEHTLMQLQQCGLLQRWPGTVCSINLSGQCLSGEKFLRNIQRIIQDSGVPASNLCFEVTETAAIHDLSKAKRFIERLRSLGSRFALDDFGAGLSSFTYLRTLPLDYVKIDGFFVKDILTDPVAETMVRSIHEVGSVMGLETVAEYVENQDIQQHLTHIGIHYGQGYGIGKPEPLEAYIQAWLNADRQQHG